MIIKRNWKLEIRNSREIHPEYSGLISKSQISNLYNVIHSEYATYKNINT